MSEEPEEHFADLHVFAAIEVICENSIIRTKTGRNAARKIARICREQGGVQLRGYERKRGSL
jgi:hypothetical protein